MPTTRSSTGRASRCSARRAWSCSARASRWPSSTRRSRPTRASRRRSSTSTCRSRSSTLCGFVFGGICAVQYLRSGDPRHDLRSYTAIHQSLIFCIGALITGSLWAKASWGQWWVWDEPTLVSFLIVFLLYATYQPLRFSIEDHERQSRYAAVFAIVAGAFVPINFIAVRLADPLIHPRVLNTSGGDLPGDMRVAFYTSLDRHGAAVRDALPLRDDQQARRARSSRRSAASSARTPAAGGRSAAPEPDSDVSDKLPDNGGYVAAAYLVFLVLLLIYVAVMATRASRLERELADVLDLVQREQTAEES